MRSFQIAGQVKLYNILIMCVTFFCLYPYDHPQNQNQTTQTEVKSQIPLQMPTLQKNTTTQTNPKEKQVKIAKNQQKSTENGTEQPEEKIKFIIAFNRDEQTYRKTLKMGPFVEDPNIYAGRDSVSTGTWLGINIKTAIMVVLTNYDLPQFRPGKSRGKLVQSFLSTAFIPQKILNSPKEVDEIIRQKLIEVLQESQKYPAFNLMVMNIRNDHIFYICSELNMKEPALLQRHTIYGLCNTDLNTIWPKTKHGCNLFENVLKEHREKSQTQLMNSLTQIMKDRKKFSQNPNDQASIFIQPFYSTLQNAHRMTKSTFICLIKSTKDNSTQITMRQITHEHQGKPTETLHQLANKNYIEDHDHVEEAVVQYRFCL